MFEGEEQENERQTEETIPQESAENVAAEAAETGLPVQLSAAQARVLGALIEKESTTPDYYPLSLNALSSACNQRTNREPVMDLDEDEIRLALRGLEEKKLAARAHSDGRVAKFEHHLGEAFNFTRAETALVCLLLLRGPQTPGELRSRSERLHRFDEIPDVVSALQKLMERTPALVAVLPRQPGTKESRYSHLFCGAIASAPQLSGGSTGAGTLSLSADAGAEARIAQLETTVAELLSQVAELQSKFQDLFA